MEAKTIKQLKEIAQVYGLRTGGVKALLIQRIRDYEGSLRVFKREEWFTEVPDEIISNHIVPFLEFDDFDALSRVNKRYRALLISCVPLIVNKQAKWLIGPYAIWIARHLPIVTALSTLEEIQIDWWARYQAMLHLTGRIVACGADPTIRAFATDNHPYIASNKYMWEVFDELITVIRQKFWKVAVITISSLCTMQTSEVRYLGELLAARLTRDELRELLERSPHLSTKEPCPRLITFALISYINSERYDDYRYVVENQTKNLSDLQRLVTPYITLQAYIAVYGKKMTKKNLKQKIYNRRLYFSLDTDQRSAIPTETLYLILTPQEYVEALKERDIYPKKWDYGVPEVLTIRATILAAERDDYTSWTDELISLTGIVMKGYR